MTDEHAELDAALERVIEAAREHLAAVRRAAGKVDDDDVWQAYVDLNNASHAYDELLLDAFGEVTPWDVESIDPDEADQRFGVGLGGVDGTEPGDPHPRVISVRQRRDYRVPSVAALLRVAEAARRTALGGEEPDEPVDSVGAAVLELLESGDVSLASLDVPELEPLEGVVTVTEVSAPLDVDGYAAEDGTGPFQQGPEDRLVGRLDDHPYVEFGEDSGEDEPAPADR
ncbi:hypothetical protein [Rhizomonospora bruguierae]|uniref:hypothetical protein n=1 Tax=Rhizomonospora bruguierae TaxID=1581705 RepID=UPI001BCFE64A|nr:hypothetical protein [Micromonospora sp. NBRC 107566]